MLPGQQLVQDDTEREQVGARIDRERVAGLGGGLGRSLALPSRLALPCGSSLALPLGVDAELFGRHVRHGAAHPRGVDLGVARQVEIEEHGAAVGGEQHVARLEVAVADAAVVDVGQRVGQLHAELHDPLDVSKPVQQRPGVGQGVLLRRLVGTHTRPGDGTEDCGRTGQRRRRVRPSVPRRLQVAHDGEQGGVAQVGHADHGQAGLPVHPGGMHGDDVGVVEPAQGPALAGAPPRHLEDDQAVADVRLPGQEHLGEGAASQPPQQLTAAEGGTLPGHGRERLARDLGGDQAPDRFRGAGGKAGREGVGVEVLAGGVAAEKLLVGQVHQRGRVPGQLGVLGEGGQGVGPAGLFPLLADLGQHVPVTFLARSPTTLGDDRTHGISYLPR
jgi:hypothetical protein